MLLRVLFILVIGLLRSVPRPPFDPNDVIGLPSQDELPPPPEAPPTPPPGHVGAWPPPSTGDGRPNVFTRIADLLRELRRGNAPSDESAALTSVVDGARRVEPAKEPGSARVYDV